MLGEFPNCSVAVDYLPTIGSVLKNAHVAREDSRLMHDPLIALRRSVCAVGCTCQWIVGFGAGACVFVAKLSGMGFSRNLEVRSAIE